MKVTISDDANITEDTDNKSNIDDNCCFGKKKRRGKRKERTPRNNYPVMKIPTVMLSARMKTCFKKQETLLKK